MATETEIEVKARVDDPEALAARLAEVARCWRHYDKRDEYFRAPQCDAGTSAASTALPREFRLRVDEDIDDAERHRRVTANVNAVAATGRVLDAVGPISPHQDAPGAAAVVTFKDKTIDGGVEVSREVEFTVSEAAPFRELVQQIGCQPFVDKRKIGSAYRLPLDGFSVLCELSLVIDLGYFIEIEILQPERVGVDEDGALRTRARACVLHCLDYLGIPADCIEARPYTRMLAERRTAPATQTTSDRT